MKAKIINGQIEYFVQPDWLLGDANEFSTENGYKDVIYKTGAGGTYETESNIVIETPELIVQKTVLTPLEFLGRFSIDELRAIFTSAKTNIDVEIWKIMFDKAQNIDLTDPLTIQGVDGLSQLGLISDSRKSEILLIA